MAASAGAAAQARGKCEDAPCPAAGPSGTSICEVPVEEVWPLRHVVMWPEKDLEFVKVPGDEGPRARHFGVRAEDGRLTSVVSLFEEGAAAAGDDPEVRAGEAAGAPLVERPERAAQFRKLATLPEFRRRGQAGALVRRCIEEARAAQARRIWCNARAEQAQFYAKLGLQQTVHAAPSPWVAPDRACKPFQEKPSRARVSSLSSWS
ncbi:unnamed protein product [Prorocentrum cordatum]|uniref:N-acetyltransferase domain-containing protein n=1 Tax=Prorocentrum cordatum TaxID=2364126 RepID=A0ABN9W839_9DINO|nr:unnamed protein product [Polarella glacialis]